MTYGEPASWGTPGTGPAGPQYPYGPPPTDPYQGYWAAPYGQGGYPPPPQQYPPSQTNILATLSVVFAFVFAPVGAVLGHAALRQIRRTFQRGRDRALVGLTLSYTFIVIAVIALAAILVTGRTTPETAVTATTPEVIAPSAVPSQPAVPSVPRAAPAPTDVSKVLLPLDEVKEIMKTPGLAVLNQSPSGQSGGAGQDATGDPPECAGVVAPGVNTVYDNSGATAYQRVSFGDPGTATMVEQVAAGFASPSAARRFVAENADRWRQCGGKKFTISSNTGTSLVWDMGTAVVAGDRLTVRNTLTIRQSIPQYRIMAAKGTVVIDMGVFSKTATTEPDTIAERMLSRVPA
jgi:hypothetical protein